MILHFRVNDYFSDHIIRYTAAAAAAATTTTAAATIHLMLLLLQKRIRLFLNVFAYVIHVVDLSFIRK